MFLIRDSSYSSVVSDAYNPSQLIQYQVRRVGDHPFTDRFDLTFLWFPVPTNCRGRGTVIWILAASAGADFCIMRTTFILGLTLIYCCFPDLSPLSSLVWVLIFAFVAVFQFYHRHSIDLE